MTTGDVLARSLEQAMAAAPTAMVLGLTLTVALVHGLFVRWALRSVARRQRSKGDARALRRAVLAYEQARGRDIARLARPRVVPFHGGARQGIGAVGRTPVEPRSSARVLPRVRTMAALRRLG